MTEAGEPPAGGELSMLTFRVRDVTLGLPSARVAEVLRQPTVTRVPHAPECILGVASLRGRVTPVVSTARLLDLPGAVSAAVDRTILLELAEPLALAVDEVIGLERISASGGSGSAAVIEDGTAVRSLDIAGLLGAVFGGVVPRASLGRSQKAAAQPVQEAQSRQLLTFHVAGQTHALPLETVEAVTQAPETLASLPKGDRADLGLIAYRRGALPVVDLARLLGLEPSTGPGKLLVVRLGASLLGLKVDGLGLILRVAEAAVTAAPALLNRGEGEASIEAVARVDRNRVVSILAPERLFRAEALEKIMSDGRQELEVAHAEQGRADETFLLFQLGGETYGLPIAEVQEVTAEPDALARVPNAPAFIEGVMNLRGQVVPVIDQGRRFGGGGGRVGGRKIIITQSGPLQAGFIVDAVSSIRAFRPEELSPAPELLSGTRRVFDRVAQAASGEVVLIVDAQALLDQAEADVVAALAAGPEPRP